MFIFFFIKGFCMPHVLGIHAYTHFCFFPSLLFCFIIKVSYLLYLSILWSGLRKLDLHDFTGLNYYVLNYLLVPAGRNKMFNKNFKLQPGIDHGLHTLTFVVFFLKYFFWGWLTVILLFERIVIDNWAASHKRVPNGLSRCHVMTSTFLKIWKVIPKEGLECVDGRAHPFLVDTDSGHEGPFRVTTPACMSFWNVFFLDSSHREQSEHQIHQTTARLEDEKRRLKHQHQTSLLVTKCIKVYHP